MNTNTKTEVAAYAEMQRLADERQRWAEVLCAGPSCHQGRERCATPGRCTPRHDDDRDVQMLGVLMLVAILSIGAAVVAVLA